MDAGDWSFLLAPVHVCSVRKSHLRPSFECGVCGRYARRTGRVKSGECLGRLRAVGADGRAQPVVQRQYVLPTLYR